jgi:hypothetical protein
MPAERKTRKRREDWTRIVSEGVDPSEPRTHIVCTRCGERFVMELPIAVTIMVAIVRGFVKLHRYCVQRPLTGPQP